MRKSHTIDIVFALVLFCVFAVSVLLVLISGASSYKNISSNLKNQYEERTCLSYISMKARHCDYTNSVDITLFGSGNALQLTETVDGESYSTMIYYYNGAVMELYSNAGHSLEPDAGQEIIQARGLSFEMVNDSLIRVVCVGESGSSAEMYISLRSEGGEVAA